MRILLVEDEPELAQMLVAALTRDGMIVDHAPTLAIAREAIHQSVHEAVVLDRGLPDGDGLDLIAQIKENGAGTPVIVLSALDTLEQKIEGLDTGADDYLAKPFAFDELLARLRAVARRPAVALPRNVEIGGTGL